MKVIGIDIGTTSICGISVDVQTGKIINSITKNSNAFIDGCAAWEKIQSVEKIITLATDVLESLIDDETAAIGVTGQMHGIVYVDKNQNAVSPLYTWQDERGNLPYKETTYAKYLGSYSGYGNVTDFYNRENEIKPKDAVSYCTIHDYFVMKLCNLKEPLIHTSDAASFGLYDIEANKFNYDYDVKVTNDYTVAGEYKKIPVAVAIGDNQASVFSTLANEEDILFNIGTGSQVSIVSDSLIVAEGIETRPYIDNKYLIVGAALCGGRAYSILKNFYSEIFSFIKDIDDEQVYQFMAETLQKSEEDLLVIDTRFAGTRDDANLCGSINGLTPESFNPTQLTRGILNGMVDELCNMYDKMNASKKGIVGSGNGLRKNSQLVKNFENKFGAKMKIPAHMEEAAFGAALFAGVASGIFKNANEAQKLIKYE